MVRMAVDNLSTLLDPLNLNQSKSELNERQMSSMKEEIRHLQEERGKMLERTMSLAEHVGYQYNGEGVGLTNSMSRADSLSLLRENSASFRSTVTDSALHSSMSTRRAMVYCSTDNLDTEIDEILLA